MHDGGYQLSWREHQERAVEQLAGDRRDTGKPGPFEVRSATRLGLQVVSGSASQVRRSRAGIGAGAGVEGRHASGLRSHSATGARACDSDSPPSSRWSCASRVRRRSTSWASPASSRLAPHAGRGRYRLRARLGTEVRGLLARLLQEWQVVSSHSARTIGRRRSTPTAASDGVGTKPRSTSGTVCRMPSRESAASHCCALAAISRKPTFPSSATERATSPTEFRPDASRRYVQPELSPACDERRSARDEQVAGKRHQHHHRRQPHKRREHHKGVQQVRAEQADDRRRDDGDDDDVEQEQRAERVPGDSEAAAAECRDGWPTPPAAP